MNNTVKEERRASKNEEKKVKKEIAELWAWQLSEKCQMEKTVEDFVAFLMCRSIVMDITCCHISQSKE